MDFNDSSSIQIFFENIFKSSFKDPFEASRIKFPRYITCHGKYLFPFRVQILNYTLELERKGNEFFVSIYNEDYHSYRKNIFSVDFYSLEVTDSKKFEEIYNKIMSWADKIYSVPFRDYSMVFNKPVFQGFIENENWKYNLDLALFEVSESYLPDQIVLDICQDKYLLEDILNCVEPTERFEDVGVEYKGKKYSYKDIHSFCSYFREFKEEVPSDYKPEPITDRFYKDKFEKEVFLNNGVRINEVDTRCAPQQIFYIFNYGDYEISLCLDFNEDYSRASLSLVDVDYIDFDEVSYRYIKEYRDFYNIDAINLLPQEYFYYIEKNIKEYLGEK